MVSKVEPDRYADTGFSVKDTAPEVNALLFKLMMQRSPGERLRMGMGMLTTARQMVWASLPPELDVQERRAAFYQRFYGKPLPSGVAQVDIPTALA